jgi:lysophospholipase L1-like esterase
MNYREILDTSNDNPLDTLVTNGGFCGILRKVGCIGDSLSSGEFESLDENGNKGYHDMYDYSWGQFMAREAGLEVLNFSRGGMSAKWYCDTFADENDFWNHEKKCKAYIIALGVNDISKYMSDLGDISDVDLNDWRNNKDTFVGNYCKIIQRYREIEPKSRVFLITIPRGDNKTEERNRAEDLHRELIYKIADLFDFAYVVDLRKYMPVTDEFYRKSFKLGSHENAMGYQLFSRVVMTYIDYIIRKNTEDFTQIGFVGTEWHNTSVKW